MWTILLLSLINIDSLEHFRFNVKEDVLTDGKACVTYSQLASKINIFKVMRNAFFRDFYFSLLSTLQ